MCSLLSFSGICFFKGYVNKGPECGFVEISGGLIVLLAVLLIVVLLHNFNGY